MDNQKNFFLDIESFRIIDTRRIVFLGTSVLSYLLTEFGRFVYRPYIYEHHIDDFGLADSVGNWGGILVQIFLGLAIINTSYKKGYRLIGFFVVGYIIYEVLQLVLPKGTFDWKDIYGTLIGGIVGVILYVLIHKLMRQKRVYYRFG